jgi:hypothetical protein
MLRLFASINQQHRLFSNAKLFILIINSDRNIQMICDSQESESARSTLFGTRPEKKAAGSWLRSLGHEHMLGQHILVERFWATTPQALVY